MSVSHLNHCFSAYRDSDGIGGLAKTPNGPQKGTPNGTQKSPTTYIESHLGPYVWVPFFGTHVGSHLGPILGSGEPSNSTGHPKWVPKTQCAIKNMISTGQVSPEPKMGARHLASSTQVTFSKMGPKKGSQMGPQRAPRV